mmetsp:Transcript_52117/g.121222  ORF Transcript_52117/g.121222 Transcript_52117/m.121222 type:complete len:398 (+) Transcript_52117:48-1241(+)
MALCRSSAGLQACPLRDFKLPKSFEKHPGGQLHLEDARKSECAGTLFLSYHISSDMGKVAAAADALGVAIPERGPLYDEIHALVRKLQAEHPMQHVLFVVWCLLSTAVLLLTIVWWALRPGILTVIAMQNAFEVYFFNVFHTRHHKGGKLFGIPCLDNSLNVVYDFVDNIWGYYPRAWHWNHQVKHHVYTNELDADPDMPGSYPVLRANDAQPLQWFHKFQSFYFPLLLPFSVIALPIYNVVHNGGRTSCLLIWAFIMFVLPTWLHGSLGLIHSIAAQMLASISLSYKFAVSHTHDCLGAGDKVKAHMTIDGWIKAQVQEAQSWGGYIGCLLYGGINLQIEHHLCPALDPPYYALMAPELRRICAKRGVAYTFEPTVVHAIVGFHSRLWNAGRKTEG